ncbi:AP-3 complex subunit [Musa troglodytarum]|uniref:AP-3 complex subunit n=1 Tax=Musa troglodytarum TaxID=320322 RepID=A0A9E7JVQ9_9LILI|nr:AP-3 complex subunit [Musa troglodytarum]
MLDLSQVPVETLDRCFKNVGEFDIVFNFNKMHTVLDEIIFGGQAREIFQFNQLGAEVCNRKLWPLVCYKFQDVVPGNVHHCAGFFNLLCLS